LECRVGNNALGKERWTERRDRCLGWEYDLELSLECLMWQGPAEKQME
jgi:hypothetical protein